MVTSPRTERDALLLRATAEVGAMHRPLARAVPAAVRRHAPAFRAGGTAALVARVAVMREVDAALVPVYGRYRGDSSAALYGLVVDACWEAWRLALDRSWTDVWRRLRREPVVLAKIEGGT